MVLAYPRSRLVIASRAAALPAPIDGPTLRDQVRHLTRDTEVAEAAGMSGRLCLDAGHAETINALLSPSTPEIDEARRTLARLDAPTDPMTAAPALRGHAPKQYLKSPQNLMCSNGFAIRRLRR